MRATTTSTGIPGKNIIRILLVTACILLVPLVAMQFTEEVDWGLFDFIIIGTLLIGTGLTYEALVRKMKTPAQRAVLTLVVSGAFLLIWAELAVGIFGSPFAGS